MKASDRIKRGALEKTFNYFLKNPEHNIVKIMDLLEKVTPDNLFANQRKSFRNAIDNQDNWHQLIMRVLNDTNPKVRDTLIKTFVIDGNLMAWPKQEENRDKYECNIPWAILLDPTSACNLHCEGCWAAEYGHNQNLSLEEIGSIINQGKELGTHVYIYTGGEPLVRKKDLIALCEMNPDCAFLAFTNGTLVDEDFCQEMIRVKNFVPAISVEGFEAATDARRGEGTYQKVNKAMELLHKNGLPFGVSCCFTSANADSIASEEFFDWLVEKGALFAWIFTYMPVGVNSPASLIPNPDQREYLYHFVRKMRSEKPLFTLDFQNDGEFVGGCIAGGRRYLHINSAGDVDPCVFVHYSNANIREVSLLDALRSPIFMEYYREQPFNDNLLRPCPLLENSGKLTEMVDRSGAHSSDLEAQETAEELCGKTKQVSLDWTPYAQRLWNNPHDPMYHKRHETDDQGMAETDMNKFKRIGRVRTHGEE